WHLLIRCCRSRTNRSQRICADPDQVVPAEHDLGTSTPNPNAVRLSTHVTRVLGAKLCSDSLPASREDCGGVVQGKRWWRGRGEAGAKTGRDCDGCHVWAVSLPSVSCAAHSDARV